MLGPGGQPERSGEAEPRKGVKNTCGKKSFLKNKPILCRLSRGKSTRGTARLLQNLGTAAPLFSNQRNLKVEESVCFYLWHGSFPEAGDGEGEQVFS